LAFVLVADPGLPPRLAALRRVHLPEELLAGLVETNHGKPRVVGQAIGLQHVFHPPDVLAVGLRRHTPGLHDPGVNGVFFRAWRTVSVLTDLTRPNATSSSASRLKVQWQRPSGGSVQASRINCCSTLPLSLILSGRGG